MLKLGFHYVFCNLEKKNCCVVLKSALEIKWFGMKRLLDKSQAVALKCLEISGSEKIISETNCAHLKY